MAVAALFLTSGVAFAAHDAVEASIESFRPERATPGTSVIVSGNDLVDVTHLYFNGQVIAFDRNDAGQIVFVIPAAVPGTYPISIRSPEGIMDACCFEVLERPGAAAAAPTPTPTARPCFEAGKNMQCGEFGSIVMDSQRDIRGRVIDVTATVTLDTNFADRGARWILFSVRNATSSSTNPVQVSVTKFATPFGDVPTTKVESDLPYERNMWVHVVDVPVDTPITIGMRVGATERGAYRVETLVMAFDRGYAPLVDSTGSEASLFAFTLLGVNQETASLNPSGASASDSSPRGIPTPGALSVAAAVGLAALGAAAFRRRW